MTRPFSFLFRQRSLVKGNSFYTQMLSVAFLALPLVTGCPGETPGAVDGGGGSPSAGDAGDNGNLDDGGLVVVADGGGQSANDAGSADGGVVPLPQDGGVQPARDGGAATPQDGGRVEDSGTPIFDAGTSPVEDAGQIVDPPTSAQAACDEATRLEDGITARSDTSLFPDFLAVTCTTRTSREQVFVYTSTAPLSIVDATVTPDGSTDFSIAMRLSCLDDASELACEDGRGDGQAESLGLTYVPAGTDIFIIVDGFNADDYGPFSLVVNETEIPVLGEGDFCDPAAANADAVCDPFVEGLACHSIGGNDLCAVEQILLRGDACSLDDTASICNADRDEECIDYGLGAYFCDSRLLAKCEQALELNGSASGTNIAIYDDMSGTCDNTSSTEAAFTYTVLQDRANLSIVGDADVSAVYVRTDCSDATSEVECSSTNKVDLFNVRQGQTFTLFGESRSGAEVTFTVTETTLTLLATDVLCNPDDIDNVCNFERDLECLVVQGENRCVELSLLAPGDLCNPDDTGVVCSANDGYFCIDDGLGVDRCLNPEVQQCLTPTLLAPGSFASAALTADVTQGSCGGSSTKEAAFSYVVQAVNAKVTFFSPSGPDEIYIRSDCADSGSELACSSSNSVVFDTAIGGETLTVFVEKSSGAEVVLGVFEEEIVVLAEGEACDADSDTVICDARANHLCINLDDTFDKCTDTTVANDTCETATPMVGVSGTVGGDLTYAANDYNAKELGDCAVSNSGGSYSSNGDDVVFSVVLQAGETINAAIVTEGDASILLLDACPPVSDSCVVGADATLSGSEESISYLSSTGGTYFVVVDTYSGNGGIYSLTWSIE